MTDHYPPRSGPDTSGAFRGLVVGAVILFIILVSIVKITNAHYEHAQAAEATK